MSYPLVSVIYVEDARPDFELSMERFAEQAFIDDELPPVRVNFKCGEQTDAVFAAISTALKAMRAAPFFGINVPYHGINVADCPLQDQPPPPFDLNTMEVFVERPLAPSAYDPICREMAPRSDLRRVRLRGCCLGPAGAVAFAKALRGSAGSLEEVDLRGNWIGRTGGLALGLLTRFARVLEMVDVGDNALMGEGAVALLDGLQSCAQTMKQLNLKNNCISKRQMAVLSGSLVSLHNLTSLDLSANKIKSGVLDMVPNLSALTSLGLGRAFSGDDFADAWPLSPRELKLISLDVSHALFGEQFLKALVDVADVKSINLSFCQTHANQDDAVLALANRQCRGLQDLNLECAVHSDEGADAVVTILAGTQNLKGINLSRNPHLVARLSGIARSLCNNSNFASLRFSHLPRHIPPSQVRGPVRGANVGKDNVETSTAFEAIFDLVRRQVALTELDLGGFNCGDNGTIALANALSRSSSLRFLDLSFNSITDAGAVSLAGALSRHPIDRLLLNDNKITADGAIAVVKACAGVVDFVASNCAIEPA